MNKKAWILGTIIVLLMAVLAVVVQFKNAGISLAPGGNTSDLGQTSNPNGGLQNMRIVAYTDSGFVPEVLTIPLGTTVVFRNQSSSAVHPASDPHPTHTGYPTTGGCISSTFDACMSLAPGDSWSFKFDLAGSWGYHDHFNPGRKGTIIVQSGSGIPNGQ